MRGWLAGALVALGIGGAGAAPVEVTDVAGRTVTVERPVARFVLGEGRTIPLLAMLRPDDPVKGLVGMMSPLRWAWPEAEARLLERFPGIAEIPLFGAGSAASVSAEMIIDLEPQVAIFGLADHGPGPRNGELLAQLEAAGITVVFVDFRLDPLANTVPSIALLGRLFGAEARAAAYIAFHQSRVARIRARVAGVAHRPSVFVQVHPGRRDCCWGMADGMLGPFVGLAGGRNIADAVAPGPTARHSIEFLLAENPEVWIGTASGTVEEYRDGGGPVAVGAGMTPAMAADSLARYLAAPELRVLDAVRTGRAHAVWHGFYNSPFNIVALEAFATWIHPALFADVDPRETWRRIQERFLPFRVDGAYLVSLGDG